MQLSDTFCRFEFLSPFSLVMPELSYSNLCIHVPITFLYVENSTQRASHCLCLCIHVPHTFLDVLRKTYLKHCAYVVRNP